MNQAVEEKMQEVKGKSETNKNMIWLECLIKRKEKDDVKRNKVGVGFGRKQT